MGAQLMKSCSSTQPVITLSSGEAELYGVVRAAANGLGYLSLLADFGIKIPMRVCGLTAPRQRGSAPGRDLARFATLRSRSCGYSKESGIMTLLCTRSQVKITLRIYLRKLASAKIG